MSEQKVAGLFLAGATFKQIAQAVGVDEDEIEGIVRAELSGSAGRRAILTEEAAAIHQERTEALFRAHWAPAIRGDHRSAEICRRILDRQARELSSEQPVMEGDAVDEISARRAARRAGTATGSSRPKRSS